MQESHSQLLERAPGLPIHPQLKEARKANRVHAFIFFACLLLFTGSLSCLFIFSSFFHASGFTQMLLFFCIFLVIAVFGMSMHGIANRRKHLSFWERMEARRQTIRQRESHPFPVKPLSPDASTLSLPFQLRQPPGKMWMVGEPLMLILSMGLILWGWQKYQPFSTSDLTGFQLIATGMVGAIIVLMNMQRRYRVGRKRLLLTEEGLIVPERGHNKRMLPWNEACLFAWEGCTVRGRNSFTLLFELAGPNEAISWEWVIDINPDMPPQADTSLFSQGFDPQLDAVLSLIAGRTGLPLYDLQEYKAPKKRRRKQDV
ncbi:MAG: hypothetical protein JO031_18875 [Ktedonobacteraceae bacterium]|nr:hypothetical protein [Ktedonobacteraceae bacterium]